MEQKIYDSPTKSPVIQEIIMSNRIGAISIELAKRLDEKRAHDAKVVLQKDAGIMDRL